MLYWNNQYLTLFVVELSTMPNASQTQTEANLQQLLA